MIEESTYFDPYQLLFSQGKFYFPTKEQIPIIEQIKSLSTNKCIANLTFWFHELIREIILYYL